jgi:2-polyprenyl-6-methoxyphenol hydroxylase-like FAD-dependent oxidoreductase
LSQHRDTQAPRQHPPPAARQRPPAERSTSAPGALQRAVAAPGSASPHELRLLQRAGGNRAVQRLVDGPPTAGGSASRLPFQADMERSFGQDFSNVEVRLGREREMAAIGAQAATRGEQVTFATRNPTKETVAHELTHVVQNRQAGVKDGLAMLPAVSRPGDAAEREAESASKQAAAGRNVDVKAAPAGQVQRQLDHVIVLGGGPIGLISAIEAKLKGAKAVTVYEKRSEPYSRKNVPTLEKDALNKLKELGVYDELFRSEQEAEEESGFSEKLNKTVFGTQIAKGHAGGDNTGQVAIQHLEEVLVRKAKSLGIKIVVGFEPTDIEGIDGEEGRAKRVRVKLAGEEVVDYSQYFSTEERPPGINLTERVPVEMEDVADLLVVATGAGASDSGFVKKLGFRYNKLKAKDYATYGIYRNPKEQQSLMGKLYSGMSYLSSMMPKIGMSGKTGESPSSGEQMQKSSRHKQAAYGQKGVLRPGAVTKFHTPQHNYILGFLHGLTKADFTYLQKNKQQLKLIFEHVGLASGPDFSELLDDPKALGLFKVKLRQAVKFVSDQVPAVVIGDAAATPHPRTGSGLNTGVPSVNDLGHLVERLSKGEDSSGAFQEYHEATESRTTTMLAKAMDGMNEAFLRNIDEFDNDESLEWRKRFKETYNKEWTDWFDKRKLKSQRIAKEFAQKNYENFDWFWAYLNKLYSVISTMTEGKSRLGGKLKALEDNKPN